MKLNVIIALSAALLLSCSSDQSLTKQEKVDCKNFKQMKGQDRYEECMKIYHLFSPSQDAIPKIESYKSLVEYLGEPDIFPEESKNDSIIVSSGYKYLLNGPDKKRCELAFFLDDEIISFIGFNGCTDFAN